MSPLVAFFVGGFSTFVVLSAIGIVMALIDDTQRRRGGSKPRAFEPAEAPGTEFSIFIEPGDDVAVIAAQLKALMERQQMHDEQYGGNTA